MSKLNDLTGRKFGALTVKERAPSKSGKTRWLCECECGKHCIVFAANLIREHTTSCGCKKQSDLKGKRFGSLTVLERSDVRIPRGNRTSPTWKCQCECGAIVYRATDTLTNNDENMCPECAARYAGEKMRKNAGFTSGTQLTKITNMKPTAANTSGVRGVAFEKNAKKWRAMLIFQGKRHHLGLFSNFEDAVKARKIAEEEYFGSFLQEIDSGQRDKTKNIAI